MVSCSQPFDNIFTNALAVGNLFHGDNVIDCCRARQGNFNGFSRSLSLPDRTSEAPADFGSQLGVSLEICVRNPSPGVRGRSQNKSAVPSDRRVIHLHQAI